jgi:DNA-binding NarL/FixJ family response regulator
MKGYRMVAEGTEAAAYGYPAPPDPAERRSPLAEPQGVNRFCSPRCEDCPDCGECLVSVIRGGQFARQQCEMAFGGGARIINRQATARTTDRQRQILEVLAQYPEGATGGRITRATGLDRQRVRDHLERLVKRGHATVDRSCKPYVYRVK